MKTSYFNPEVHSLPFLNSGYVLCGVTYYQCGGMCCTVLDNFYKGKLISCESSRSTFGSDITNKQVGIIGSDPMKSCDFGEVSTAIPRITKNISEGKPTLLYLDLEWGYLNDHFVIAYAIHDISPDLVHVYIYDPNWVYKRHYCNDHKGSLCIDPGYTDRTLKNFESYLEVDYKTKKVTLFNGTDNRNVPGFKWYGLGQTPGSIPVSSYTGECNVGHNCYITLEKENAPEIINNIPVISHKIKISKNGNVAADLKLDWEGCQDLFYESADKLFPINLKDLFSKAEKHTGLQAGSGKIEKKYTVYQNYAPSDTATIILQSNFIKKSLQIAFTKPAIETFATYAEGANYTRKSYSVANIDNQIINIQGLDKNNVVEVERIPDGYTGPQPACSAFFSYNEDDKKEIKKTEAFTLYPSIYYLGYIKSNIVIEIMHNGRYTDAYAVMTPDGQGPINKKFDAGTVTFTLKGGSKALYDANASQTINFKISGGGVSSEFTESFNVVLQYRCLIIHRPDIMRKPDLTVRRKPFMEDYEIFARYFEKSMINNLHTSRIPELENRFNLELAKHPGMDKEEFKALFSEQLIKRFVDKSTTFWNHKKLYRNFIDSYNTNETYRKERTDFILTRSKNFEELKRNFEILEDQMRPLIGKTLIAKRSFERVLTKVLKREWK
jgi:hypothetical protein